MSTEGFTSQQVAEMIVEYERHYEDRRHAAVGAIELSTEIARDNEIHRQLGMELVATYRLSPEMEPDFRDDVVKRIIGKHMARAMGKEGER